MLRKITGTAACVAALVLGQTTSVRGEPPPEATAWGYSTYGIPGLIEMPGAYSRPDGELSFTASSFGAQNRLSFTFQVSDRLSESFRYAILHDIRASPTGLRAASVRFDRSFSLHYRLLDEGRRTPALAIGINDLVGTGIYGGEYVVATKTLSPALRASVGLGWARLGSDAGLSNPLSVFGDRFKTRPGNNNPLGGTFEPGAWFHGDAALFGGLEWHVNDRLRLIAEHSSDDYVREDGTAFDRKSPLNIGLSWQANENTTLAAQYLYGSEIGIRLTYALNPKTPRYSSGLGV